MGTLTPTLPAGARDTRVRGVGVSAPRKPRDVGNGLVCASFGANGEWLSLGGVDPEVGFVELTGLPVFDPELRGDPEAVLRYRSWMRREEHAFLHVEAGRASRRLARGGAARDARRRAAARRSASRRDRPAGLRVRVTGRLARPTLAQISPVTHGPDAGPDRGSGAKTRFKVREGTLRVSGPGAPVIVQAWLRHGGETPGGSAESAGGHAPAVAGAAPADAHRGGLDRLAGRRRGGPPRHRLHVRPAVARQRGRGSGPHA